MESQAKQTVSTNQFTHLTVDCLTFHPSLSSELFGGCKLIYHISGVANKHHLTRINPASWHRRPQNITDNMHTNLEHIFG